MENIYRFCNGFRLKIELCERWKWREEKEEEEIKWKTSKVYIIQIKGNEINVGERKEMKGKWRNNEVKGKQEKKDKK